MLAGPYPVPAVPGRRGGRRRPGLVPALGPGLRHRTVAALSGAPHAPHAPHASHASTAFTSPNTASDAHSPSDAYTADAASHAGSGPHAHSNAPASAGAARAGHPCSEPPRLPDRDLALHGPAGAGGLLRPRLHRQPARPGGRGGAAARLAPFGRRRRPQRGLGAGVRLGGPPRRRALGVYSDEGPTFDYSLEGIQGGTDIYRRETDQGQRDHAGAFFTYGRASGTIYHVGGVEAGSDQSTPRPSAGTGPTSGTAGPIWTRWASSPGTTLPPARPRSAP
ncbi:MAG: hypothetical protein WDN45_06020 [Caulobacteraceae bacterium]